MNCTPVPRLSRPDWAPEVKAALNALLADAAALPPHSQYAVFDFDNTTAVFDIEEQTAYAQLCRMAFALPPEQLAAVLLHNLTDPDADCTSTGLIVGSCRDLAADIRQAYAVLWQQYGPFTADGLPEDVRTALQKDDCWQTFAAKMYTMYRVVCAIESEEIAYMWILGWFTGMTEPQVYRMAAQCVAAISRSPTRAVTLQTPAAHAGRTGAVTCLLLVGIGVTENMRELWRALQAAGVDVWVCSASCTGAVRAAVDGMGLHPYLTGILALTPQTDAAGRWLPDYDYNGCGWLALSQNEQLPADAPAAADAAVQPLWQRMTVPQAAFTVGEGKVTAIVHAIAPRYGGHGPIAGFMDSGGDFQFCTEFSGLRVVTCFNRANRSTAEGGGLIAAAALYQRDTLHYDYAAAQAVGDTLYLLQGRQENGLRGFVPDNQTLLFDETRPRLFKNADNHALYRYLCMAKPTTKYLLDTLAMKGNPLSLPFAPGFLERYAGYHSRR